MQKIVVNANNADSDQALQSTQSDFDSHCLKRYIFWKAYLS